MSDLLMKKLIIVYRRMFSNYSNFGRNKLTESINY